jgi:phosphoribosylformylglycinamidine synthase I
MKPNVLILRASGINRDQEAAWAIRLAGGQPDIVHINQLRSREKRLSDYQMMVLAGGFSYGDALGAGRRLALDLRLDLEDELESFVAAKKPVLGICNGFQALVKANLLPSPEVSGFTQTVTLTHNQRQQFECRWVTLTPNPACQTIFLADDMTEPIYCPVAHGEGRFVAGDAIDDKLVALRYGGNHYPENPNGSEGDVAGICDQSGLIMGLMPHPEDHIVFWQHPRWTRGEQGNLGLPLFRAGVKYAAEAG